MLLLARVVLPKSGRGRWEGGGEEGGAI